MKLIALAAVLLHRPRRLRASGEELDGSTGDPVLRGQAVVERQGGCCPQRSDTLLSTFSLILWQLAHRTTHFAISAATL
jgi:hypothetical protein